MKYTEGDLFEGLTKLVGDGTVVIAHVCNDEGKMGAGFVLPLQEAHPDAKTAYEEWHRGKTDKEIRDSVCTVTSTGPCSLGETQFVQVLDQREVHGAQYPRVIVANMVAQTLGGKRPLYYNHLVRCMTHVASLAGKTDLHIVCPMFGGGLAGGDWRFIHGLIEDAWQREKSDVIEVTVYYLKKFVKNTDWEVMGVGTPAIQEK
jgi:O-acetyl-ADP-ribose deacetylase (regulator of RNase III)